MIIRGYSKLLMGLACSTMSLACWGLDSQCGTYQPFVQGQISTPMITRTIVHNNNTYQVHSQLVAVTEAATDTVNSLAEGDEVCYKANAFPLAAGGTVLYAFEVHKK